MKHPGRVVLLAATMLAATGSIATVFMMKKSAEQDARAIGELNIKIASERQRISELRAEWSALDHPARLQRLVERNNDVLRLEPIRPEQIARVGEIASAMRRRAEAEGEGGSR